MSSSWLKEGTLTTSCFTKNFLEAARLLKNHAPCPLAVRRFRCHRVVAVTYHISHEPTLADIASGDRRAEIPISISTYRIEGTKGKHHDGRSRLSARLNSPGVAGDALTGTAIGVAGKFALKGCRGPFNGPIEKPATSRSRFYNL